MMDCEIFRILKPSLSIKGLLAPGGPALLGHQEASAPARNMI
jgi:hypothetical protein